MQQKITKESVRKRLIYQRDLLKRGQIQEKSEEITKKLLKFDVFLTSQAIFLYLPINNEVETGSIFNFLLKKDSQIYVPAFFKEEGWAVCRFTSFENLVKGPYGILQPSKPELANADKLGLAIIPVVGFSTQLFRLGYGKGVYDRLLNRSTILKIGLAYDLQLNDDWKPEGHDLRLDFVITEKGIFK